MAAAGLRLPYSCCYGLILLAAVAALATGSPCPPGWGQRGFWCYLINSTSTLSWAGAGSLCQERDGVLLTVTNRTQLLDVLDLLRGNNVPHWWIGIQRTTDTNHEQVLSSNGVFDNFGDDKLSASPNTPSTYQCVYLSSRDSLWYWTTCDSVMHYICQKPADRVSVQLVTPERQRPNAAWFAAHARNIEDALYAIRANSNMDDDKGELSPAKVTMTPIPPSATTMTPPVTSSVMSAGGRATATTSASLCQGRNWLLLDDACYQLMLDARNWTMASEFCRHQGGQLATFRSTVVQRSFVSRFSHNSGSVWLGLHRALGSGVATWVDGARPAFSSWADGEPVTAGRAAGCGALTLHTGEWSDQDCSAYKPFACRRSLDATSMATTPTVAQTTTAPSRCGGGGWWEYRQSCFLLVTDSPPVGWHAAQQGCRERSANLAKIDSNTENSNIFHRVTQSNLPVWVGLNRLQRPHLEYTWTDGSTPTFTSWEHGHNSVADLASCARMDNENGSWRAVNCNSPQYYVCQKPVDWPAAPPPPPPPPPAGSVCPQGWSLYGTDRCLQVSDRLADWSEARRTCRNEAHDGELVTIADPVQQAFVTDAIRHSTVPLWIGLTYLKVEHRFPTWTDEAPVNYTNWASGHPSNMCDDCPVTCGLLGSSRSHSPGAWSAVDCSQAFQFVCQRPTAAKTSSSDQDPPSTAAAAALCQPPHSDYRADGDACLKVVRQPATWQAALSACQAANSSLAYIADVFDNARLMKLLYRDGGDQYWLALSDTKRYGIPQWSAPWPAEPTFTNWEPEHAAVSAPATCSALRPTSGQWRHLACSQPQPYVCLWRPLRERAPPAARCPPPARQWAASDRRCYRLHESIAHTRTWSEAKQACEEQGQQLAVISSKTDFLAVMEVVSGLTNTFTAWIGARQMSNGSFLWVDGTEVQFDGWIQDEPSQLHETCVEASKLNSGRWNNMRCNMYRPFVCMVDVSEDEPSLKPAFRQANGGSGGGWRVFGVVCLALTVLALLIGAAFWLVRRRQRVPRHHRLPSRGDSAHHGRENPVYDGTAQPLDGRLAEDGGYGLNGAASNRWRSLNDRDEEEHPL